MNSLKHFCVVDFQIDRATLERTINMVNEIYLEAESLSGRTYCESCFACLTAYLAYLCMDTYYEKVQDLCEHNYYERHER